jgi:DNA modification methylase
LARFEESEATNTVGPMAGRGQAGLRCVKCGKWKVSGSPCVCPEPEWEQSKFNRPKVYNNHATVKPLDLMTHLVRLVCPPGGVVLDCFAGSGTTLKAAELEGRRWIGIEQDAHYARISRSRLTGTQAGLGLE